MKLFTFKKKDGEKKILKELEKKRQQNSQTQRKNILKYYLKRAGFETDPALVLKRTLSFAILISLVIVSAYAYRLIVSGIPISIIIPMILPPLTAISILAYLMILLGLFIYLDIRIYQRKVEIESVLSDFLQLASANMHAGMTLDKALWFAIRPRFGILAREIEEVAKESSAGTPLEKALQNFAEKYDSQILHSSISLIVEGLHGGGEMAPLLARVASNIRDNQLMMREMSANVSTYVIFIGAATLFAAPLLMALSYQLVSVVSKLSASLDLSEISRTSTSLPVAFSKISITPAQFRIFAILSLAVTALFSALIVSVIRTGDIRGGAKTVIMYVAVSILLFIFFSTALGGIFSSLI